MEKQKSSSIFALYFEPWPDEQTSNELREFENDFMEFEEKESEMGKIPYTDTDQLDLPFGKKLQIFRNALEDIDNVKDSFRKGALKKTVNEFEISLEIAITCKKAIDETDFSRDQVVDAINGYYGRSDEEAEKEDPTCRKPLTIGMLNNYLSAPAKYPMPAFIYYAIMQVTRSKEPARYFAEAIGGKVVSGEEVDSLTLGKLSEYIEKAKVSEKILKKRMRKKLY